MYDLRSHSFPLSVVALETNHHIFLYLGDEIKKMY